MSVSSTNDTYMEYYPLWERSRHFIQNIKNIKSIAYTENYLPKPNGMDKNEYIAYVQRAEFCPFVARTAEGFHGMIFRKVPTVTKPENIDDKFTDNVDGKGSTLEKFIADVTWDTMITGWGGCLVDVPKTEDISQRLAEEQGIFPYITYYKAEDILNYQTEVVNRAEVVTLIVLRENVYLNTADKFTRTKKYQYRVLELDENNVYKQSLYNNGGHLISEVYPKKNNQPLNYIPFYFFTEINPSIPIFNSLIEVNESWYRKSADLENGLHWIGVPTPYCLGYEPETDFDDNGNPLPKEEIKLGGSQVLFFPQGTSHFGYLEFSGAGLNQLQNALSKDEERMAMLGARIISSQRRYAEAYETAKINRASENSVIATFANSISEVFTKILKDYLEWSTMTEYEPNEIIVKLNTDYDIINMTPQELQALVSAWQSGAIDSEVLFYNMKEGEYIPSETSYEDLQERIQAEREKISKQDVENFFNPNKKEEIENEEDDNEEEKKEPKKNNNNKIENIEVVKGAKKEVKEN